MAPHALFFQALVNRFDKDKKEELLKVLPEEVRAQLAEADSTSSNWAALLPTSPEWLFHLHYSWLIDPLKQLPKPLILLAATALSEESRERLKELNLLPTEIKQKVTLAESSRNAFASNLLHQIFPDKNIVPKEWLPHTPLDPLLACSKGELVLLADLLAMFDLSEEIRTLVDKKMISAIARELTPSQQKYLKVCLHQKSKVVVNPLNAKELYKESKKFKNILHARGLKRLAQALSGLPFDFCWHIAHTLDIGRGKIVLEHYEKEAIPLATQVMQLQTAQIVQLIKGKAKL